MEPAPKHPRPYQPTQSQEELFERIVGINNVVERLLQDLILQTENPTKHPSVGKLHVLAKSYHDLLQDPLLPKTIRKYIQKAGDILETIAHETNLSELRHETFDLLHTLKNAMQVESTLAELEAMSHK